MAGSAMEELSMRPDSIHMKNVRMTFGFKNKIGILVRAVDMHYGSFYESKWCVSMFNLVAPTAILETYINALDKVRTILLTGEDGTRYRVDGMFGRFVASSLMVDDMMITDGITLSADDVVPLEKGPTHYESIQQQKIEEASRLPVPEKDSAGEEAIPGVAGEAGQDEGKDPS